MEQGTKSQSQKPTSETANVKVAEETQTQIKRKKPVSKVWKEKYFWVRFDAKRSINDSDDVVLSVNGEVRNIKREEKIVLPERYLVCADNTTYPHFTQMPGEPRKIVGRIKVYPYDRIGEATEKEYRDMLAEGTKQTVEEAKRNMQKN